MNYVFSRILLGKRLPSEMNPHLAAIIKYAEYAGALVLIALALHSTGLLPNESSEMTFADGLWHGLILPVSVVAGLFWDTGVLANFAPSAYYGGVLIGLAAWLLPRKWGVLG